MSWCCGVAWLSWRARLRVPEQVTQMRGHTPTPTVAVANMLLYEVAGVGGVAVVRSALHP